MIPLWVANTLRNCSERVNTLTKLLIYLPGVTCSVALVVVWNFIFWPNMGLFSQILTCFGITNFSIFDNANHSIPLISLLIVFSNLGQKTVIFCSAINGIPQTYYEAAELDGANGFQQFKNITVPMLYPIIVYVLVTNTIGALQIYVVPQLMTGGGPNYTSSTLLMLIYNSAFNNHQFGYASALGVILFVIASALAVVQFKITKRDAVEY
jgi:multiple sugar transport system permease protein